MFGSRLPWHDTTCSTIYILFSCWENKLLGPPKGGGPRSSIPQPLSLCSGTLSVRPVLASPWIPTPARRCPVYDRRCSVPTACYSSPCAVSGRRHTLLPDLPSNSRQAVPWVTISPLTCSHAHGRRLPVCHCWLSTTRTQIYRTQSVIDACSESDCVPHFHSRLNQCILLWWMVHSYQYLPVSHYFLILPHILQKSLIFWQTIIVIGGCLAQNICFTRSSGAFRPYYCNSWIFHAEELFCKT